MAELNRKVSINLSSKTIVNNDIYFIERVTNTIRNKIKEVFFVKRNVVNCFVLKFFSSRHLKFPFRLNLVSAVKKLFFLLNATDIINDILFNIILMKFKNTYLYHENLISKKIFISYHCCSFFIT